MRIKRLDITGFKSFMDRSVFTFDDGVTGIVGPNGCGKSNVVDAIRWVMGEQSAKNLRGRGMEDVIFNGSESKAPLSMAEVSLTFRVEAGDQLAPPYAGFPEVTVTRRLFRSGESEYLINKAVCRLLDITELFLGTGVGTRAYSIIEQGRVGLIVSSKPEDRRALIEEAAGVTKYKARRKAAERKMEYTQQNLLRVNDIVKELERRLDSLDRQARKAEKYKKLKVEMREIELHSASHKFLELTAESKVLQAQLENLGSEERESFDRVRALEDAIGQRREQLESEGKAIASLERDASSVDGQLKLLEQSVHHWGEDLQNTRHRLEQARVQGLALTSRLEEIVGQSRQREDELGALSGSWKEDEVAVQVAQEELRRATHLETELVSTLAGERQALVAVASRLGNQETTLVNLGRTRADIEARSTRNRAEAGTLREEELSLDRTRSEAAEKVTTTRQTTFDIATRRGMEEDGLARTRQAFAENEIQVISLREELADKRSRLSSLEEIQRNYEGFDRGVRAIMLKAGERARELGIFGLVAEVVSTPARYEKALEGVLGERLQHVVVESQAKGLEWIEYLRGSSEGRSTFVPVEGATERTAVSDVSHPAVLARAVDEVHCEDALKPIVQKLLGDVLITADLASARELSAAYPGQITVVTLEGDVLRANGVVTGGTLEGPAVGALQKKREIVELTEEVRRTEERYSEILTRHYTLQKQMGHAEGVLKGLAKHLHSEEVNLATQEKDLHKAGADLAKLRDRLGVLDQEDAQLTATAQVLTVEEEAARGEVAHGQADRQLREERARQLGVESEAVRERSARLMAELTSLRVKVSAHTERSEAMRKELEQLTAAREDVSARRSREEQTAAEAAQHATELEQRLSEAEGQRHELQARLEAVRPELDVRKTAHHSEAEHVRQEEHNLRELRLRLDEVTQGLSQISLKERELALQTTHLIEHVQDRHQAELRHEVHAYHLLALPKDAEPRLKELRSQIERMGEINLTAIEEHAELSKRYEFLSAQQRDLEGSLEQLKDAIVKIDRTSRERFKQTFDVVNEKFQQIFPRLFGGGRASLVLTDEGPGAEQGVDVIVQPPGKKLQNVNLLSGGEKALTAVSMIFAIFLIKPTPFCLLDEVDAPLDEGNVGRYNEMVKEMSQQSQFILITHNKRTMEVVDTLYGVTMEEPGISKLVSVKISEAVAANDNQAA